MRAVLSSTHSSCLAGKAAGRLAGSLQQSATSRMYGQFAGRQHQSVFIIPYIMHPSRLQLH